VPAQLQRELQLSDSQTYLLLIQFAYQDKA
jgi:hypothetical protein